MQTSLKAFSIEDIEEYARFMVEQLQGCGIRNTFDLRAMDGQEFHRKTLGSYMVIRERPSGTFGSSAIFADYIFFDLDIPLSIGVNSYSRYSIINLKMHDLMNGYCWHREDGLGNVPQGRYFSGGTYNSVFKELQRISRGCSSLFRPFKSKL